MVPALVLHALLSVSQVTLYTMGPGADLFSTFGHAAICVGRAERSEASRLRGGGAAEDAPDNDSRCYNYGTADFATPLPLTWSFIRGRALFWVSVVDERDMLGYYASENRAVYRQPLSLAPDQSARLAAALEASTDERVKYYRYHHFHDNCTTRIRDLVDGATGGALHADPVDRRLSFREWARDGFKSEWPLLVAVELLLGRSADQRTDSWQAMFLPSELRAEIASRLHSPPQLFVTSTRPPLVGAPWLGELALIVGGILLGLIALAGRPGIALVGVVLALVGTILWGLFALSTFPELTRNENLFVYWPSDLALGLMPDGWRLRYVQARLLVIALVLIAHLGLLVQPLASLALPAIPFLVIWVKVSRWPRRAS